MSDSAAFSLLVTSYSQLGLSGHASSRNDNNAPRFPFRWLLRYFSHWLSRTLSWAEALTPRAKEPSHC